MSALAMPHARVSDVVDQVRVAHETRTPLRIAAGDTWRNAGRPVATPHDVLDLGALSGVVEYVPGDLVLTVGAATTLAEIDAVTAPHGQWIGLDPFGSESGTVGATVATASVGPLSQAYGAPRDQLLGLEYVAGDGTVATGGGRVVKNVAGFDVVRLHCGAWGTLGALTSVSLRCFARPAVDDTIALPFPEAAHAHVELLDSLRTAAIAPLAAVLLDGAAARHLGLPDTPHVVLRLGGNPASVRAQRAACDALGRVHVVEGTPWSRIRALDGDAIAVARVSARPATLVALWQNVTSLLRTHGVADAEVRRVALLDRGVLRVAIDRASEVTLTTLIARLAPPGGAVRWERLPAGCWPFVQSGVDDALSRRVRLAFDPHQLLNRGILGEPRVPAAHTG